MSPDALKQVLDKHAKWLRGEEGGERANLSDANLPDANLSGANLSDANLSDANLSGANLSRANLSGAKLSYANLSYANLSCANLSYANLSYANLSYANLSGAKNIPAHVDDATRILLEGELIGWKKLADGTVCKLRIPPDARRSNATGRKCRAEFVDVLEGEGVSSHDGKTRYAPGARVTCDSWCEDRWQECAGGIHFFITRGEAERY